MKLILTTAVFILLSSLSFAQERDEAWLSKEKFDGKIFSYEYVAYGNSQGLEEQKDVKCHYGYFGQDKVLKSVDFKIYISGSFDQRAAQTKHSGKIDVTSAIENCISSDSEVNRNMASPVALNFPKVSVSSKLTR